ncbi:hypothetical protein BHM03_00016897 [Ensete ventricosum]|nr:hypothetical protein BHM03_00016897 [Ensete ventricosum]
MASKPNLRTLTLALAMSEEDDDDFQNPSEAFSVAQNRILSSMKDPCLRTLKPSTGARPRKRPRKLASAQGKENLEDSEYIAVCSSVPSTLCVGEERMRAERKNFSLDSGPGSLEKASISASDCCIHFERDPVVQFDGVSRVEKEKSFILTSVDPKVVESGGNEGDGSIISEGTYYSRSIESRLLESRAKPVSNIDEGGCLRVDDWEDFDAGTQLNELMNLCCEMDDGGSSHGGALLEANEVDCETVELKQGGLVECSVVERHSVRNHNKPLNGRITKDSIPKRKPTRNTVSKGKVREVPPWCCIPGTPFRVKLLTDYQGLNKNFYHGKIYCSSITAHLVNMKIGVPWDRLQILPLNQNITLAGVGLTCFDANHCPGSIIILFEPPNGKFVIEAIQAEAFNPKTLFLIGSYTIVPYSEHCSFTELKEFVRLVTPEHIIPRTAFVFFIFIFSNLFATTVVFGRDSSAYWSGRGGRLPVDGRKRGVPRPQSVALCYGGAARTSKGAPRLGRGRESGSHHWKITLWQPAVIVTLP